MGRKLLQISGCVVTLIIANKRYGDVRQGGRSLSIVFNSRLKESINNPDSWKDTFIPKHATSPVCLDCCLLCTDGGSALVIKVIGGLGEGTILPGEIFIRSIYPRL